MVNLSCADRAGAPLDSFYGNGLMGQRVIVVPSQDLVVVRLGLNFNDDFDQVPLPACSSSLTLFDIIVKTAVQ